MAYTDLTLSEQQAVAAFFRDYRAAIADVVRSLRTQDLLVDAYLQNVQPIWSQIADEDVIPDGNGLANSGIMTKADWNVIIAWSTQLLQGVYDVNGGTSAYAWPTADEVDTFGVQAAGPSNI